MTYRRSSKERLSWRSRSEANNGTRSRTRTRAERLDTSESSSLPSNLGSPRRDAQPITSSIRVLYRGWNLTGFRERVYKEQTTFLQQRRLQSLEITFLDSELRDRRLVDVNVLRSGTASLPILGGSFLDDHPHRVGMHARLSMAAGTSSHPPCED